MITAEEARKQSIEVLKSTELGEIEEQINSAIQRGYFSITVSHLSDATKQVLVELGYKIDWYKGDHQLDDCWEICW